MSKLWYKKEAQDWNEALPLGNGRMGAMVYGTVNEEHIQVNEDSIWYGGKVDRTNPDTKENLPEIRRLILNGEIKKAEKLMRFAMSGCPDSAHPSQTLGDIHIQFENLSETNDYYRELDLNNAVYKNSFISDNIRYEREMFFSHPDDVLVMRFSADKPGKITFSAMLRRWKFFDGIEKCGKDGIRLYGNLGIGGFLFAMELKARTIGGQVKVIGENLIVEEADEAYLFFTAGTTYRMKNVNEEMDTILDKILQGDSDWSADRYEAIKDGHRKDYQSFFNRVEFSLGDLSVWDKLPTDERIKNAQKGEVDLGLSKLYFDFGRYLLIACSRPGTLPATLQGIWNKDMTPPWDCKYTININTQMNYWPAENCNLSECHEPLFELIEKMVENGEYVAEKMYGCRGFVCHHNTDIWGDCVTQDLWIPGSYW